MLRTSQLSTNLGADLARADAVALRLAVDTNPSQRGRLNAELDRSVDPATDAELAQLTALHAGDGLAERAQVARLARGWTQFGALRGTGVLASQRSTSDVIADANRLSGQISTIFDPLSAITRAEAALEATHAGQAHATAVHTYHTSMVLIWAIAIGALVLGVGSMLLLTRNVVPRIRRYSQFASAVAGGDLSGRLTPRGSDELTTLGRALNEMVERRSVGAKHQAVQSEFVDALQMTDREEIAHDLLRRQVERSIPASSVVVLNRNNSENRLEATTKLRESSSLNQTLIDAQPRSCMAVLFARPHHEEPEDEPLTHCEVCGKTGGRMTCEPLLVGGEVIGSVLVEHAEPLSQQDTTALRESVTQAAPVLANLRNLALAEFRASTDGLTGLPNKRTIQDTIKRMTAQASRTASP
jgi:HAMP domain-containing protein/GGDEF domain-containing protein